MSLFDLPRRSALMLATAADAMMAERPNTKAHAVALATLSGQADAIYSMGVGQTPFQVKIAAIDAIREFGPRPHASGDMFARREWMEKVEDFILKTING